MGYSGGWTDHREPQVSDACLPSGDHLVILNAPSNGWQKLTPRKAPIEVARYRRPSLPSSCVSRRMPPVFRSST